MLKIPTGYPIRYKLIIGKFAFYFFDSYVKVDLTLEMVLNRLNGMSRTIDSLRVKNDSLTREVFQLKERLKVKPK